MERIEVFSPAKINLFLAVLGRGQGGFHDLASLVAPLDFGDRVVVSAKRSQAPTVELECSDPSLPTDGGNLAFAAAERFLRHFGFSWTVRVQLEKRLPQGAGLGGGSSNASATLQGLAGLAGELEGARLDPAELVALAAELGSDCPLFMARAPVVMRGRGERLSGIGREVREGLRGRSVVLFKPSFSIGTAWAYGALASKGGAAYDSREWAEGRLADWEAGDLPLDDLLHNAFERVVFPKYPAFETLFRRLGKLGLRPLLSGSGSCCFALLSDRDRAEKALAEVAEAWGVRSFRALARIG